MKSHIKTAAEWQEIVTQKDKEIENLQKQVTWLTQQFKLMQSRQFAASSEKAMDAVEQLTLFNEAEVAADSDIPEPELEKIVYTRKKQKGKREMDFSSLPTEQIIHELPEGEHICPDCGGILHACTPARLRA